MTDDSLEAMLKRVGGSELVSQYEKHSKNFKPNKQLPHADADAYSYSYCVIVGGLAALADTLIDQSFRLNMNETHRLLDPEEQNIREKAVQDLLKTQNLKPSSGPAMSMDFYDQLNDSLNLQSGFKLRAKNHRILNHTNQSSVIDMLMSGDAGLGGSIKNSFPKMNEL